MRKQQTLLCTDRYKHQIHHCDFGNCFIMRHPHRAFTWRPGILNCNATDKDGACCFLFPQSIPSSTACDGDNCYPALMAFLPSASGTKAVLDALKIISNSQSEDSITLQINILARLGICQLYKKKSGMG